MQVRHASSVEMEIDQPTGYDSDAMEDLPMMVPADMSPPISPPTSPTMSPLTSHAMSARASPITMDQLQWRITMDVWAVIDLDEMDLVTDLNCIMPHDVLPPTSPRVSPVPPAMTPMTIPPCGIPAMNDGIDWAMIWRNKRREYIDEEWVVHFVATRVGLVVVGDEAYNWYAREFEKEFGRKPRKGLLINAILIDRLLVAMSKTGCQDISADRKLNIVSPDLLPDESHAEGVQLFLRRKRCYTGNDTRVFNCLFHELQRSHPSWWSRTGVRGIGTKSITQIMDAVGSGPPETAIARNARPFRGPADTDPTEFPPEGPKFNKKTGNGIRQTDGLFFNRYVFTEKRATNNAGRLFE
ncbi:hypothetical protein T484DRAFT_1947407 [Baffinella frigidus]|nr:hypothetical protein T484DRAFT_1947407 [Cryptophyta sp. CCMP2293]